MLVLSRKEMERIKIGDNVVVTVVRIKGDKVRIGIEAPSDVIIMREEVPLRTDESATKEEERGAEAASTPLAKFVRRQN